MNILITGGTGYLGSLLVNSLITEHKIFILSRNKSNIQVFSDKNIKVLTYDQEDLRDNLKNLNLDIVIHTACLYETAKSTVEEILSANLVLPIHLLEIAIEIGVKTWINTSTSLSQYTNTYGLSKYQFSQWGKYLADKKMINFYDLKLESFYGNHQKNSFFIPYLVENLRKNKEIKLSLGTQKRDFISVIDVISVYEKVLKLKEEGYYMIPVGTGISPSIREVALYLKDVVGSSSYLHFGAIPQRENEEDSCCDIRILEKLGMCSFVEWKSGLREFVEND